MEIYLGSDGRYSVSKELIKTYRLLWEMLSDCVENGRLDEANLADDYEALCNTMEKLANLDRKGWELARELVR